MIIDRFLMLREVYFSNIYDKNKSKTITFVDKEVTMGTKKEEDDYGQRKTRI